MDDQDRRLGLSRLLAATARAHHEATGGINDAWATWYAERLVGDIDEFVGFEPPVDQVRDWLIEADEIHGANDPDGRWPSFYAQLILKEYTRD